jgi:RNA 2'-phosphotransferase, Tpt1 / KptA family
MTRTHIHFAAGLPDQDHVISGMRKSASVYIYVDAVQCANDGITFYESSNGVLLSDGIDGVLPCKYFSHVIEVSTGKVLLDQRATSTLMQRDDDDDDDAKPHDDADDDMTPTATALQVLKMLQPAWKEISIPISKKDIANRSANFDKAFNDSSVTNFFSPQIDGELTLPKPPRIVGIEESGEVI